MQFTNVNTNLYKSFLAVFNERNVSRAAEKLNKSQPTITHEIKSLEEQLGIKLFHTHPRGVNPTHHAEKIYDQVKTAMDNLRDVEIDLSTFDTERSVTIKIAFGSYFAMLYSVNYITDFKKNFPNVHFKMDFNATLNTDTDLLIRAGNHAEEKGLSIIPLKQIKQVHVVSKEFAERNGLKEGVAVSVWELATFPKIGKGGTIQAECETAIQFVRKSLGVGLFPEPFVDKVHANDGLVKLTVEDVELPMTHYEIVYNERSLTKTTDEFLRFVKRWNKDNIWAWSLD